MSGEPLSGSGNYRLYRSTVRDRTYLVVSTFYDQDPGPSECPSEGFAEVSITDLGDAMWEARQALSARDDGWEQFRVEATLRTHGYNTRSGDFLTQVLDESDPEPTDTLRPDGRFYLGYRWPSVGVLGRRSVADTIIALAGTWSISWLLLLLPIVAITFGRFGSGPMHALAVALGPYLYPPLSLFVLGFGSALLFLRLSTYLSDRYRALHYGVPDLAEFIRDLDDQINPRRLGAHIDLVGHSMGCLLLVNAIRTMSDFFHYPGDETTSLSRTSTIRLRTMVLCGADIPAALAVPGRNNYFLASLRRCSSVHVLSSDHDVILKWASNLGNWASEPRYAMSSQRLGNALLVQSQSVPAHLQGSYIAGDYLPVTRPNQVYVPASRSAWSLDPGCKEIELHIHDCSRCRSVGGDVAWGVLTGLVAALVGVLLWVSRWGGIGQWCAVLLWILYALGALSRWLQTRFVDRWWLGPRLSLLADWPSTAALAVGSRNPHGGYFTRGDIPRRLIAELIRSHEHEGTHVSRHRDRIRSSALRIVVGPPTPSGGAAFSRNGLSGEPTTVDSLPRQPTLGSIHD